MPGGEVEQAGAGERAGEVEEAPAVLTDVQAGGVELGVHPAERGQIRAVHAFGGRDGECFKHRGDVCGALAPTAVLAQAAKVAERPLGKDGQRVLAEHGQQLGGRSLVEGNGSYHAVSVADLADRLSQVLDDHAERAFAGDGADELRHRDAGTVRRAKDLVLVVERLDGVLVDRGTPVVEAQAFDSGHAPHADRFACRHGVSGAGADVGKDGGDQHAVHERRFRSGW